MVLVCILHWCHDVVNEAWVPLKVNIAGRNQAGAPWIPARVGGLSKWTSPLTRNTLAVWDRINKSGKYAPRTSPLASLGGYKWFPPGEEKGALDPWESDGDTMCLRYATLEALMPQVDLVSLQGDMAMAEQRYGQMQRFFSWLDPQVRTLNSLTTFAKTCRKISKPDHLMSQIYKLIRSEQSTTTPYFIKEWEIELECRFPPSKIKKLMQLRTTRP